MSEQIQEIFSFNDINVDEFQPNLSSFTNLVVDKKNYPIVNLPFPPLIEPKDLIIKKKSLQENPDGKPSRAPNAFIIYRKAFVKATRDQGYMLPMTLISSMASASWDQENVVVKEEYKRIAKETHKLIKEMYPKKSNRRKRKDKWNLVSFQNKSSDNNKFDSIITETSPIQTNDEYLTEELNNVNLPNSFQEYLNQPINDFSEMYSDLTFDGLFDISSSTSIDDLKEHVTYNNPRSSSLDMTLAEAFCIINSENFDLGFEF
ncbi:9269_t:CDS:2 [Funneliformis geosporum]|uniref:8363_t:CDS:1 n=1 Tax=Funneliformis geosporum TaxID=1117311 RepID=A0A9W4WQY5_9GLOM|nr:8363_t:CDS:2 [Funneliformis geosporum]CAI2165927.1 9269_t:CDS:2 [Funneliformis geosporum]